MSATPFEVIRQLRLPTADYAIFGSGPLIVRGIVPFSNDVDILCRGEAWAMAQAAGSMEYLAEYGQSVVKLGDGSISLGTHWGIGDFDTDELISSAEIIDSLPFVQIRFVIEYKQIRAAPKDLRHLQAIRAAGLNAGKRPNTDNL